MVLCSVCRRCIAIYFFFFKFLAGVPFPYLAPPRPLREGLLLFLSFLQYKHQCRGMYIRYFIVVRFSFIWHFPVIRVWCVCLSPLFHSRLNCRPLPARHPKPTTCLDYIYTYFFLFSPNQPCSLFNFLLLFICTKAVLICLYACIHKRTHTYLFF